MRRSGDLARALLGLLMVVVVLGAIPAALVILLGFEVPTQADIDALPERDALLTVLNATGRALTWLLWAQFAYALVRELIALAFAKPTPRIAVSHWVQQSMKAIAVMTFLPFSTIRSTSLLHGVAVQPLAAYRTFPEVVDVAESAYQEPGPIASSVAFEELEEDELEIDLRADPLLDDIARANGVYLTQRGDSWWAVSERLLGTGSRWAEIRNLNIGEQVTGDMITPHTENMAAGWYLSVPADAESGYLIKRTLGRRSKPKPIEMTPPVEETVVDDAAEGLAAFPELVDEFPPPGEEHTTQDDASPDPIDEMVDAEVDDQPEGHAAELAAPIAEPALDDAPERPEFDLAAALDERIAEIAEPLPEVTAELDEPVELALDAVELADVHAQAHTGVVDEAPDHAIEPIEPIEAEPRSSAPLDVFDDSADDGFVDELHSSLGEDLFATIANAVEADPAADEVGEHGAEDDLVTEPEPAAATADENVDEDDDELAVRSAMAGATPDPADLAASASRLRQSFERSAVPSRPAASDRSGRLAERFAQLGADRFADANTGNMPALASDGPEAKPKGKRFGGRRRGGNR